MSQDPLAAIGGIPDTPQQDPLAAIGGIPDTTASTSSTIPEQSGIVARSVEGVKQFSKPILDLVRPPESPTEGLINHVGGGAQALAAYRIAKGVVDSAENLVKSGPGKYDQARDDFSRTVKDFHNKDYRNALSDVLSSASDIGVGSVPGMGGMNRELSEGLRPGGNLATPLVRDLLTVGTGALGNEAAAPEAEAQPLTRLRNPFRRLATPLKDVGKEAAAEPGAAAVRTASGAAPETPILAGAKTVVDDPIADLAAKKVAEYKKIDDVVGFDRKAEMKKLSDTQYALQQPGADVMKLQGEIQDSELRLSVADKKLAVAKIDPKVADNLNTSWEAGKQFKKGLVAATSSDGTVNVDQLLNSGKRLRLDPKYGDRLAQFFGKGDAAAGKPLADAYMSELQAAQKAGVHAMKVQRITRWVGGIVGAGLVGAGVVEGAKTLLAP